MFKETISVNLRQRQEHLKELKKIRLKEYYKILGVNKNANQEEIKKAYRKKALEHHPDRHFENSEIERLKHEKIFKEIVEAYGVLSGSRNISDSDIIITTASNYR